MASSNIEVLATPSGLPGSWKGAHGLPCTLKGVQGDEKAG